MSDQERAPIWEAMLEYRKRRMNRFHVPGHKGGEGLDDDAEVRELLQGVYGVDLTEIPGLDDLHQPEGVIAEAEQLAAECYGAQRTHFLIGGSTSGNLALILSLCKPGDLLLVQRDAHKSVVNGLMLAGARAVFLQPRIDPVSRLPGGLTLDTVEEALRLYPEAVGLLLTDPNYYGRGVDLRPIVQAAHARAVPVVVDAAHGAHYGFHPALPGGALQAGADAVVHSTHKMLTAMTMGAMLHMQGGLINQTAVARALRTIQSSSPSYPIMASLDLARRQLALRGTRLLGESVQVAMQAAEQLGSFKWLALHHTREPYSTQDPLKLVFADRTGTLSGFELMDELAQCGCVAEMADPEYVVLALGMSTSEAEMHDLRNALESVADKYQLNERMINSGSWLAAGESEAKVGAADGDATSGYSDPIAFQYHGESGESVAVHLDDAVGYTAAELIVPYPPGVPLLYPGERIYDSHVIRLQAWLEAGSRIHGLRGDGTLVVRAADKH